MMHQENGEICKFKRNNNRIIGGGGEGVRRQQVFTM